ncbi:spermidine synthase [Paenibacillus sp. sgz500958]|uniref:spermidine synthase n=1 Tax=Paenibacillus sp. sgz500958 TaxID=3242475 RepID=UPI0036D2183D
MRILVQEKSGTHDITVYETSALYGEKGSFRVLQFANGDVQGAIDLNNPDRVVLEYPRAIIHLMQSNNPSFANAFVIGHGIGTISGYYPEKRFTTAEIDPKVVELSKQYFGYHGHEIIIGDGREILDQSGNHGYDYIILDAFTSKGMPRHLFSSEFFRVAADKLESDGALLINAIGKIGQDAQLNAIHSTLREVFPFINAFALRTGGNNEAHNIVIWAGYHPAAYQIRHMSGFKEVTLGTGHIIWDR